MEKSLPSSQNSRPPNVFRILTPYRGFVVFLVALAIASHALTLYLPKLISRGIDAFVQNGADIQAVVFQFSVAAIIVFTLTLLQGVIQAFISERLARDMRRQLAEHVSRQRYAYIQRVTSGTLLTNFTADIDALKMFASQAVVSIVSSACTIIGASILLITINWKLALAVLMVIPIIGGTFSVIFGKVRVLFLRGRDVIDRLNRVINESIVGAALIRVVHAEREEQDKFQAMNRDAKDVGMGILKLFATLIPIVTFVAGLASVVILALGGHFVIAGSMSLGDFAAFNSYLGLLIYPIFVIGFMSSVIAQSSASYARIMAVLSSETPHERGEIAVPLRGDIAAKNLALTYGEKVVLRDVSFFAGAGTRTAIIGPTAAGKTQLLYLLTGLVDPSGGSLEFDGRDLQTYDRTALHRQIGFVFQDSVVFNVSLRQNIAFSDAVTDADLHKAVDTAELSDFIQHLPEGLDTHVSERGTTLSGGQKQRVMLARALALNPKILLLDDFTARVDVATEQRILENLRKNYPDITLISVTQKIGAIEQYDNIVLLMEGDVIATGTHAHLLETCPEYAQIYSSQQSTTHYEVQS